jgi:hypothetical protein
VGESGFGGEGKLGDMIGNVSVTEQPVCNQDERKKNTKRERRVDFSFDENVT